MDISNELIGAIGSAVNEGPDPVEEADVELSLGVSHQRERRDWYITTPIRGVKIHIFPSVDDTDDWDWARLPLWVKNTIQTIADKLAGLVHYLNFDLIQEGTGYQIKISNDNLDFDEIEVVVIPTLVDGRDMGFEIYFSTRNSFTGEFVIKSEQISLAKFVSRVENLVGVEDEAIDLWESWEEVP